MPRILLVDDDAHVLEALKDMIEFRMPDTTVDACANAPSALEKIETTDYDAIVSDIKMPGMDGLALMERVLKIRPMTPTLLITGHGDADLGAKSLAAGAYAFIPKPIERVYFLAWLKRAIQLRELNRQIEAQTTALERAVQARTAELVSKNQELEAALQALRRSEERLRLATEAGDIGIFELDLGTMAVQCNAILRALYGWTADEPVTRDLWLQTVHPDDLERITAIFHNAVERESGYRYEYRIRRRDGSVRWVETVAKIVRTTERRAVCVRGAVRDITERMAGTMADHAEFFSV